MLATLGPALADAFGDRFLSQVEFRQESLIGARFVDRVEPFSLEVFDQGEFQRVMLPALPHQGRHAMETGDLGRSPSDVLPR